MESSIFSCETVNKNIGVIAASYSASLLGCVGVLGWVCSSSICLNRSAAQVSDMTVKLSSFSHYTQLSLNTYLYPPAPNGMLKILMSHLISIPSSAQFSLKSAKLNKKMQLVSGGCISSHIAIAVGNIIKWVPTL